MLLDRGRAGVDKCTEGGLGVDKCTEGGLGVDINNRRRMYAGRAWGGQMHGGRARCRHKQ